MKRITAVVLILALLFGVTGAMAWDGCAVEKTEIRNDVSFRFTRCYADVAKMLVSKVFRSAEFKAIWEYVRAFIDALMNCKCCHCCEDDIKWYPDNTVCVAGLEFREVKPGLTDKWYNFAPIDLSKDGMQSFDLVAGNLNVIGKVNVLVEGDQVTVEWKHVHDSCCDANFMSKREFFTFFSDLNAVNAVEPDQLEGFEYGTPISIANDLGGDTNVLLYVNNMATYCSNYCNLKPQSYTRYWRDLDWRIAARGAMTQLMEADLQ